MRHRGRRIQPQHYSHMPPSACALQRRHGSSVGECRIIDQDLANHARACGRIRLRIDQDEGSQCAILAISLKSNRPSRLDLSNANTVHFEQLRWFAR